MDREEYSRYIQTLGDTRDQIGVYAGLTGAQAGDTITFGCQRTSGYVDGLPQTLASTTTVCTSGQATAQVTFALNRLVELQPYFNPGGEGPGSNLVAPASRDNGIYRGVAGQYAITASVTNAGGGTGPSATSETFRVTLVPTDELRDLWLRGVPLEALDVVAPLFQPQQVTGVQISQVSQATAHGPYALAFTASPPALSWAGGPAQAVSGTGRQRLVCPSADGTSYIVAQIVPWLLPLAAVTETILIAGSQFSDASLQEYVTYATGALESQWYWFVEPHTSDTDPLLSTPAEDILQARGAVPPTYHVEQQEVPMTYRRPRDFAHWMSFSLPRRQIQAVYYLYGYFNQSQAVSIGRDWIVFDPVNGVLELVPDNGAVISWQFYGAAILQFFVNYDTIPSFWHFGLATGLNSLFGEYAIVREAVAKQASVNILSAAGFSLSGGAQSRSVSRDGVTDSRTYAGKQAGAELRRQYEEWLTKNVRRIRTRYGGIMLAVT